ncbi:SufS family cysteine desulfurase [Corallincola platygyrae]|uniref:cysteine desulfurase n=1 Tax=Corallincola platygyrae TaxID=1193278 RepID=A0ABW4XQN3_9GAMM
MHSDPVKASLTDEQLIRIRSQFGGLQHHHEGRPLVYLDNAATTQKPSVVIDAITHHWRQHNANVHRGSHLLSRIATSAFEAARETVASYIGSQSAEQLVWTRGTTEAINLVASGLTDRLNAGDEILLATTEHHANIVPWQLLAERTGASIQVIPCDKHGQLDMTMFHQLLSDKTKLLAIGHASNALGAVHPIKHMITAAKALGAITLVDGAQGAAHLPVDVVDLDCDFYAFSAHKMFGPTGIGALYGKVEALASLPPWQGGGEMIEHVSFAGTRFQPPPFRFEAGTPNIEGAIGFAAAIEFINKLPEGWRTHEQQLRRRAYHGLSKLPGICLYGPSEETNDVVSLVSFTHDSVHSKDIGALLDQQNIAVRVGHHCAMPLMDSLGIHGTVRASFTVYNTLDEVDRFVAAIAQIIQEQTDEAEPVMVDSAVPASSLSRGSSSTTSSSPSGLFDTQAWQWPTGEVTDKVLKAKGWEGRNRQLMLMAKRLPGLDEQFKQEPYAVAGCESRTWLVHQQVDGQHWFAADSDARVVRGLLVLLLSAVNGRTKEQVAAFDARAYFTELGLLEHLSPSRGNGLLAIAEAIQQAVK